jgi:hypothetical protein
MVFRCGEGHVLDASRSSSRNKKARMAILQQNQQAADLALFLIGSRRDVKVLGSVFMAVVPSLVFWCGQRSVLEACRSSSRRKKARPATQQQDQETAELALFV